MSVYLSQFVIESRSLHDDGFVWTSEQGDELCSKVVTLNSCLDSVAKVSVQCRKSFQGYGGCCYCYHPGHLVDLTNDVVLGAGSAEDRVGTNIVQTDRDDESLSDVSDRQDEASNVRTVKQVRYCFSRGGVYPDRTDKDVRSDMEESLTTDKEVRGIKGMSPFFFLLSFNLVWGFVIDAMHGVYLGVARQMLHLMLDSRFSTREYSLRSKMREIDQRLLKLQPPLHITRRPQSISNYVHWKANELRSWLLYYCLPCVVDILPAVYVQHLCLLVTAMYILSSDCILSGDLDRAHCYLLKFVEDFELLYGPSQMVFNVHLLSHLVQCVRFWGPLWAYSAFCFETANGNLKRLVKGTKGVAPQICRRYATQRFMPKILQPYDIQDRVEVFCNNLLMTTRRSQVATRVAEIVLLDSCVHVPLDDYLSRAFQVANLPQIEECYPRAIVNGVLYHSMTYKRRGKKSFDAAVFLRDGTCGIIERIFLRQGCVFFLLKTLEMEHDTYVCEYRIAGNFENARAPHIRVCSLYPFGDLKIVRANLARSKCIYLKLSHRTYVTTFPNVFEKD